MPARAIPWEPLAMVLVAFALRALYAWFAQGRHAVPTHDEVDYDSLAWNLARGLGFRLQGAEGLYPTAFRPPVLPFVTGLLYRFTGHDYFAALLLQCAAGALVPVVLAGFARATWGSVVARVAGWLAAVHPLLVFFCGYLLTESLFALVLLLGLWASAEWVKTPRPGRALGTGLLWGLAILTRPNALMMPFLVAAWSWFPLGLSVAPRDRVRQVALLLLGVALAVGPWTLRNANELHAFVPVTTGGGKALLDANNPVVWNDPARRGGAMSIYGMEPWASRYRGLGEPEADALSGKMAREFLDEHRAEWPAMAGAKLARFWRPRAEGGSATGRWSRPGSPTDAVLSRIDPLLLWSLFVLPLALFGAYSLLASPKRLFLSLPLLTIAAFTASSVVYWGALRMRVPIEPLVVLHAAVGVDAIAKLRRRGTPRLELVPRRP
jgi:4-amino-4-deoxy-L-arabinose transferase-like glycosyltransferase